jgi:hypothetical protein
LPHPLDQARVSISDDAGIPVCETEMKPSETSKHQAYRARTKAKAIALFGGRCQRCGFDDARALRFHHVKPVRRGFNGLRKQAKSSTESHRSVINGKGKAFRLWCANCSCIASAKDSTLNVNLKRATTRAVS